MREDGEDMKIFGALGSIVYNITTRELINQGYLCDAKLKLIKLVPYPYSANDSYQDIYLKYIVNNLERNMSILEITQEYKYKKILIIVNHIEHGNILLKMLEEDDVVFLNSKSKHKNFNPRIIIGTSIMDEGVDIPEIEIIIMASGGKSSIKTVQRVGRVLRTFPNKKEALIFDFIDNAKYLHDHYLERLKIYQENEYRQSF